MSLNEFFDHIYRQIAEQTAPELIFQKAFQDLVGIPSLLALQNTVDSLLTSPFGQAVLDEAKTQLRQVDSGQESLDTSIANLAAKIVKLGAKSGRNIGVALATMIASMAVARLQGRLDSPPAQMVNPVPKKPSPPIVPKTDTTKTKAPSTPVPASSK